MEKHRNEFPIQAMCRVLGVSRSGYYAWRKREPSQRARENADMTATMKNLHQKSGGTYGSPRLHQALIKLGWRCGRHRVARLMKKHGLEGRTPRRYLRTTQADGKRSVLPDLIQRDFSATQPNQKWVADVTYLATKEGWLYLAVVMDLYSRSIVGWSMQPYMTAELVCNALRMGVSNRHPPAELIHHSDRGSQYTSQAFQNLLTSQHMRPSVGRTGDCYDNAVMESFFASLKRECVQQRIFSTHRQAKSEVFKYIEVFYNRQRLHSTLGYLSPLEFERLTFS